MFGRYLFAVLIFCFPEHGSSAGTQDNAGLVAIHSGPISVPEASDFIGTGFIISDGWVVTARHVVGGKEKNGLFVTVGSKNPETNQIRVEENAYCPQDNVDICFLRIDSADLALTLEIALPFEISCSNNDLAGGRLSTYGFDPKEQKVYKVESAAIRSSQSQVKFDNKVHKFLVRTEAVTPDGLSGSPVTIPGTHAAYGVHMGLLAGTQVLTPITALTLPVTQAGSEIAGCRRSLRPTGGERFQSYVMQYLANNATPDAEDEVVRMMVDGVAYIRSRLSDQPDSKSFRYLDFVGAKRFGDAVQSNAQLQQIWSGDGGEILQILYGRIDVSPENGKVGSVTSNFYLGDLPDVSGHGTRNEFEITTSNSIYDFRRRVDGHHMVTVYALLLDAIRTSKPKNVVLSILNVADVITRQLQTDGHLDEDLAYIASQIDRIRVDYAQ